MKLKNIFLSAIAVLGMVTQAFAKSNAAKNTDNNVPSGSEQVAEHDLKKCMAQTIPTARRMCCV